MLQLAAGVAIVATAWLGLRAAGHLIRAVAIAAIAASILIGLELLGVDVVGAIAGLI